MRRSSLALATLALAASCAAQRPLELSNGAHAHTGSSWWPHRAAQLGISVDQARARDAAFSDEVPPAEPDPQLAMEAALIYRDLCASCHGASGRLDGLTGADVAPTKLAGPGARFARLISGDSFRATRFRRIRDGGDPIDAKPSRMRAFRDDLSNEQIWAMVHHLENL